MKRITSILCFCFLFVLASCDKNITISDKYDPEAVISSTDYWSKNTKDTLIKDPNVITSEDTYELEKIVPFINETGLIAYAFDYSGKLKTISYSARDVGLTDFQKMCRELDSVLTKDSATLINADGTVTDLDWSELENILLSSDKSFVSSSSWYTDKKQVHAVYQCISGSKPSLIVTVTVIK